MAELTLWIVGIVGLSVGLVLLGLVLAVLWQFLRACGDAEKRDWLE